MKKCVNGKTVEMTPEEISELQAELKESNYREQTRPRTIDEGMLELNRAILADKLAGSEDKTLAIACMAFFEPWTPGSYAPGDIRADPATGYPRECILAHDSTVNTDWTIRAATLWKPYHSRKKAYALPWEAPTGTHDLYKAGEYMVWTDCCIYKCVTDTNFTPVDYPSAWEKAVD